ncbi:unnamed protein product [Bursaphelenchus okinawaensis]|uniref:Serine/threonine-protein phosphatase PGAM5, mitochondrial n=1 Tax=Bursaphelenchus okinawaensis TaxID=465554 RepID=A0A811KBP5_9BILA|nr:unnamed protein product [Bursaphelenchus okinawaensis]CAG9097584.1 unnamed protein product [Bursaphelenchus okinawaensis]
MWRNSRILGGTLATLAGTTYCFGDQLKPKTAQLLSREPEKEQSNILFPRGKWDSNWDHRDPAVLVDPDEYWKADEEKRKELLKEHKTKATRNIFLIRHGQYFLDSEKKNLTPLGQEQAQLLGERLAKTNIKYDICVMSTMNRAMETATLMLEKLDPQIPRKADSILEEGAPYPPEPAISHWKPAQKFFAEGARIEAAFRKYIHRASPRQKQDSYELIVCHANVIRYFVCRALQLPPESWLRFSLGNSSITWMVLRPNGAVSIRAMGDFGHLPHDKVSFT